MRFASRSGVPAIVALLAFGSLGCAGGWAIRGTVHARLSESDRGLVIPTVGTEGPGTHVREAPPLEGVEVRCSACPGGQRVVTDASGAFRMGVAREPSEPVRLIFDKRGYRPVEVLILPRTRENQTLPMMVMLTPDDDAVSASRHGPASAGGSPGSSQQ